MGRRRREYLESGRSGGGGFPVFAQIVYMELYRVANFRFRLLKGDECLLLDLGMALSDGLATKVSDKF